MEYFIYPTDNKPSRFTDENLLGIVSFKNFWCGEGFDLYSQIVEHDLEFSDYCIIDANDTSYSFEEFFKIISELNLK